MVTAHNMLLIFSQPPDWTEYMNGISFKKKTWDNHLYGGPVYNSIIRPGGEGDPNNMQVDMSSIE